MYLHIHLSMLMIVCAASVLLAQERRESKQSDAGSSIETGSSLITLPVIPAGKYAFLARMPKKGDFGNLGPTLPFTWIEAEWTERGNNFRGEPDVHHCIQLNRDRGATYVTASIINEEHKDHVYRKGEISERQYARICLLLGALKVGEATGDLGRLTPPTDDEFGNAFSNISTLRVHVVATDSIHTYRNDDGSIGDYRYWLVQTVIKQQSNEDIWWKVTSAHDASEPSDPEETSASSVLKPESTPRSP